MRISDWSSDVCSSDLVKAVMGILQRSPLAVVYNMESGIKEPKDLEGKKLGVTNGEAPLILLPAFLKASNVDQSKVQLINAEAASKDAIKIGRASCRERVWQSV